MHYKETTLNKIQAIFKHIGYLELYLMYMLTENKQLISSNVKLYVNAAL